jgi:hypothetical protein
MERDRQPKLRAHRYLLVWGLPFEDPIPEERILRDYVQHRTTVAERRLTTDEYGHALAAGYRALRLLEQRGQVARHMMGPRGKQVMWWGLTDAGREERARQIEQRDQRRARAAAAAAVPSPPT